MDPIVADLAAQHAELSGLLDNLDDTGWHTPTRCVGWDVADVVLHLAQSDEMAFGSATGTYAEVLTRLTDGRTGAMSIDEGAASLVAHQRSISTTDLLKRWTSSGVRLVEALEAIDLSTRVDWVTGQLSARTLATTRMSETWIHTGDVAEALGVDLVPTDRLKLIARLAWRTLPYVFTLADRPLHGPVAFLLTSPEGDNWDFIPDEPAITTIRGSAVELCAVAARRIDPSMTSLQAEGPNGRDVLELARTYA